MLLVVGVMVGYLFTFTRMGWLHPLDYAQVPKMPPRGVNGVASLAAAFSQDKSGLTQ